MSFDRHGAMMLAEWWLAQMEHPVMDNGAPDHGPSILANALMQDSANRAPPITEGMRARFREAIAEQVQKHPYGYLGSDYQPDGRLAACCELAGISHARVPIKTGTWWDDGGALVYTQPGYGAPLVVIYVSPARLAEGYTSDDKTLEQTMKTAFMKLPWWEDRVFRARVIEWLEHHVRARCQHPGVFRGERCLTCGSVAGA